MRKRIDLLLVERGLFDSRAKARAAIEAGGVSVDGRMITKASEAVEAMAEIVAVAAHDFVGRGALKLDHALDLWPVTVEGVTVLDVGASTGGFTEVCLRRGAKRVYAVDVGRDQLHPKIAGDPRVVELSGQDARTLDASIIPIPPDLVVCDLSFISVTKALSAALSLARPGADLVLLVKPQFEAGRGAVGKGGIVSDPAVRDACLQTVCRWLEDAAWSVRERTDSPITGGDGNREFLVWATRAT
ncbi:TlyA family rRNA (cytidine-2'-O)-methyltransferase [Caulobacter sp. SLTY]|uniref:TlyA family RNA methyltransferase n=1 Tax=Caulobacter sp. SLTY TaxID=2683262 RepID=UPI0014136D49|nr:TlyA family RNA methyltransferase [Caulobacter sp. SLTY]NBB16077.1 TlyA family rRNA (cytidine-2'-O)-methyltransferase [Caulobacter sp. SLTY]